MAPRVGAGNSVVGSDLLVCVAAPPPEAGQIGIGRLLDTGDLDFIPLPRIRTHRNPGKDGKFRWYNDHRFPDWTGGGAITVRLHGNTDDDKRGFNRTENVRPMPPADPDFALLYARRNDAESINRHLDDTLWLGRAHSIDHARQHLNLLGYALTVNSVALHEHRRRRPEPCGCRRASEARNR